MGKKYKGKTYKIKKYKGKKHKKNRIRNFLRKLRNLVIVCAVITGILFGVDYYQTGNVSRTMGYLKTAAGYLDQAAEQVLKPAVLFVEEKAEQLADFAAEKIGTLEGDAAQKVADFIKGLGGTKNVQSLDTIPEYTGKDYVTVNDNIPVFSQEEKESAPYEYYSSMDILGRCGYAEAKLALELMPTEERGAIGMVRPSGWKTIKYSIIDGLYLYNRCHLIGYQLAGENANEKNLITGTRYMNVTGMLPWENLVADYIQQTGDSVMYRVTPVYEGNELVARGVQMEAQSLGSDEISFNIFVFNIQPGIGIDYATGNSWMQQ